MTLPIERYLDPMPLPEPTLNRIVGITAYVVREILSAIGILAVVFTMASVTGHARVYNHAAYVDLPGDHWAMAGFSESPGRFYAEISV